VGGLILDTCQRLEQVVRVFFSKHMGGDLFFGLVTTRVFGVFVLSRLCASCAMQKSGFCFQESCNL
jgi:hypothetical protein